MYFMIDPAGTVLSVNTTGAAQLGYAVDELVGQSVLKVFIEEDREFVQRNVGVCLDTRGRSHGWEVRKVRKDGSLLWVRENAKAVWRPGNQTIILVACEDITEPRRAEEKLHQARAELAQVSRVTTLGELTAAIAHEVNQPLTGVVSSGNACLRWLADDALNLDAARHAVERMIRDSSRAAEVVSRIRALVKKSPPRYDWLDINSAIGDVLSLVGTEVQRNRVSLRTKLADGLPLVFGDRIQLQQVILNLVKNASEAMEAVADGPPELSISSEKTASNEVLVTVSDSGPGFDGANLENIFDAFYSTKSEGMGIGLAVSRSIIEAHGGKLWATPNEPRGAVFRFNLPAGEEKP
jgi:PAS domain S-box-containing protein